MAMLAVMGDTLATRGSRMDSKFESGKGSWKRKLIACKETFLVAAEAIIEKQGGSWPNYVQEEVFWRQRAKI